MPGNILDEARACLNLKLNQFGISLSCEDKEAAAIAVAAQFQKLDPAAKPAGQTSQDSETRFAKDVIQGLLAHPAEALETSLEKAQKKTGCFLSLFSPPDTPEAMQIAVKDIFRFDGHHPTAGLSRPPEDLDLPPSPLIARLRDAGAHIAATTKLSAWCYLPLELNELVDPPRSPICKGLLVGGSSSGSAAAVASGAVQVALGSDTGGSIRIPAALCGVYGFKPSRGAIPVQGAVPLGDTQDTIGLLAKSPADIQSVFEVLTTQLEENTASPAKPVVGIPNRLFTRTSPQIQNGLNYLTQILQHLGLECQSAAELDLDRMNATAGLITGYEAGNFHGPRIAQYPRQYPASIQRRLMIGLAVSNSIYSTAQGNRAACLGQVRQSIFTHCKWVLAPVISRHRLTISEWGKDGDLQAIGKLSLDLLSLNRWVNLLGLPSISIPIPSDEAIPTAVQLVGAPGSDHALLQLACELDTLLR
ncbi:amidase (plasmid) [Leisingera sp. M527]|uniref:amidase family protein n=1 Tax=Leisingera sp. M527 TaxID=2867014 RepID=UPI0021A2879C|nr:amidase [Leisingera sp. M527]UWQ35621.1 amidase [Leisingera sp. M527]